MEKYTEEEYELAGRMLGTSMESRAEKIHEYAAAVESRVREEYGGTAEQHKEIITSLQTLLLAGYDKDPNAIMKARARAETALNAVGVVPWEVK